VFTYFINEGHTCDTAFTQKNRNFAIDFLNFEIKPFKIQNQINNQHNYGDASYISQAPQSMVHLHKILPAIMDFSFRNTFPSMCLLL
jgi:hypothetical protein